MTVPETPNLTEAEAYQQLIAAMRVLCGTYAIAVFTPDELKGASPDAVESKMIEKGFEAIEGAAR